MQNCEIPRWSSVQIPLLSRGFPTLWGQVAVSNVILETCQVNRRSDALQKRKIRSSIISTADNSKVWVHLPSNKVCSAIVPVVLLRQLVPATHCWIPHLPETSRVHGLHGKRARVVQETRHD